MQTVAAAARDHVHGSSGSQGSRRIQSRLRHLKFLDRVFGKIQRGRPDGLVGNVHSIHLNTRRAAGAALHGNASKAILGGIEISAVLNLNAGAHLRQIEKISPFRGRASISFEVVAS